MTWPEVQDLRTRTDIAIIPIAALEQHSLHLPIGTDYVNGLERAKLIAQKTDVLVAPVLMAGNSPYHMEFPGTITLSSQTIQQVFFEAAQSLMKHGFKRFLLLNSHRGNHLITNYIADRINQETEGIAAGALVEPSAWKAAVRIDATSLSYYTAPMAMGKRKRDRQPTMWVTTTDLPTSASHPFYRRLNQLAVTQLSCRGFSPDVGSSPAPRGTLLRTLRIPSRCLA